MRIQATASAAPEWKNLVTINQFIDYKLYYFLPIICIA